MVEAVSSCLRKSPNVVYGGGTLQRLIMSKHHLWCLTYLLHMHSAHIGNLTMKFVVVYILPYWPGKHFAMSDNFEAVYNGQLLCRCSILHFISHALSIIIRITTHLHKVHTDIPPQSSNLSISAPNNILTQILQSHRRNNERPFQKSEHLSIFVAELEPVVRRRGGLR